MAKDNLLTGELLTDYNALAEVQPVSTDGSPNHAQQLFLEHYGIKD